MRPSSENSPRISGESVSTTELELTLLRALSVMPRGDAPFTQLVDALKAHRWEHADHRVIYEALIETDTPDTETLRRELPAVATRMGFPDIHWERFFAATLVPRDRIFELIREMKGGVSGQ